ncbi:pro-Pol polyprotein [Trichonephila clavipes]|uniref:Pro-Pol polyprotein n=1 Tax=Trichonephila clavipes TaxID=2585209 RepID=A0A8X6V956_TRICX|nr:pro-Pol polyprotein [Trichonephila clavipes]
MSNDFVKVVRSVSFGSPSLTEIGFQYNHWSDPKYTLKYGVWIVLGRWNLHHFIICAVDLCTRWAEAIPVKEISAKTTCNVLLKIFTQTGFPKMICSDQGTNFTSKLSEAFLSVMGVSPRFSTPGHPESMDAVERWNRTLKDMLTRVGQVGLIFDQDSDFGDLHYAPIDMTVTFMRDVTDHISSDCQELEDVQRLELLITLKKFSSLFSSLPGLAKVKGHNLKQKPDFTP